MLYEIIKVSNTIAILISFSPGCCRIAVFLLETAGKQQQSSKPIRIYTESGNDSLDTPCSKKSLTA
jgi:hypothetical protein